jgi:2,3-dihydroxybenzoate decarboxylase
MKIALEEHVIFQDFVGYLGKEMPRVSPETRDELIAKLSDFGEKRLAAMDAGGVTFAILSVSSPGAQAERRRCNADPNAMAASRISRCRTPAPQPTNSSAASTTSTLWGRP